MLTIKNNKGETKKEMMATVGNLKQGERIVFDLEFSPLAETILDGTSITVTIAGRYDYVFNLAGQGVKPALHFSFVKHNFGASFITAPGALLEPSEEILVVTNGDMDNSLSIDCAFVNQRALSVKCSPTVLEPGQSVEIPFNFAPREVKDYAFAVPFLVNGTSKQMINVLGQGGERAKRASLDEYENMSRANITSLHYSNQLNSNSFGSFFSRPSVRAVGFVRSAPEYCSVWGNFGGQQC